MIAGNSLVLCADILLSGSLVIALLKCRTGLTWSEDAPFVVLFYAHLPLQGRLNRQYIDLLLNKYR